MNTFAFEIKDGFRFDVRASTAKSAWNKINSISFMLEKATGNYFKYDKDGTHSNNLGWEQIIKGV